MVEGIKNARGLVGAVGKKADFSAAQLALQAASVEMTVQWLGWECGSVRVGMRIG